MTEIDIGSSVVSEDLIDRFPNGWLSPDEREGYQGYIVEKDHLLEFVRTLRDDHGYDYLSSIQS